MINIKGIKPVFNRILVTADKYEEDVTVNGLVVYTAGTLKEFQKVIAVGNTVRDVKEGDLVQINPSRYAVKKYDDNSVKTDLGLNQVVGYNFNIIELNKVPHILLYDSDVDYIISDFEEIPDEPKPKIFIPKKTIIAN